MATDEEHKEAEEQARIIVGQLFKDCADKAYEKGKKEGIQMERKRLRKQVNKTSEEQQCPDILVSDIDIWDDE